MKTFIKILSFSCILLGSAHGMVEVASPATPGTITENANFIIDFMRLHIEDEINSQIAPESFAQYMRCQWALFIDFMERNQLALTLNPDLYSEIITTYWSYYFIHLTALEHYCHTLLLSTNPWLQESYEQLGPIYRAYFKDHPGISQKEKVDVHWKLLYFESRSLLEQD